MQAAEVTRTAKHWLDEDGILRIVAFPGLEDSLEDARRNVAASVKLAAGKRRPILIDMRVMKTQSREVRAYYNGPESRKVLHAIAILVDSPMSRMIGNFFLGFNRTDVPTRLFKSEDEALAWLKGFVE
jgi:hypothetical protein